MKLVWVVIPLVLIGIVGSWGLLQTNTYDTERTFGDFLEKMELENEKTRIECKEKKGELYMKTGYYLGCALLTTDGGKSCTDSDECRGHCNPVHIAIMVDDYNNYPFNFQCEDSTIKHGDSCWENIGVCADDDRYNNCGREMINGKIDGVACLD